jgi:periplasmic protein TonB
MKYLLIFFFAAFCMEGIAQQTKKVKVENDVEPTWKDVFYVLVDKPDIRQGKFTRTYKGRFDMVEKGQYANNQKTGVWEYYANGELQQKIDYSKNEIVFAKPFKSISESFIIEESTVKDNTTGRVPLFLGGDDKLNQLIWRSLRYPAMARRMGTEGKVFISATITKDGKMIDEQVKIGKGDGLDEEALRVIKLIPDDWFPLMVDGKAVETKVVLPINFKLAK